MNINGKKVLVTGAAGFIGSHLVELLVRRGAKVKALVRYNSTGNRGWLDHSKLVDEVEVVAGDINDEDCCKDVCAAADVVFNLAALIAIPYSYKAPKSYCNTNIGGTLNLGMAALNAGVERFVQMSTSEVYGTAQFVPMTESHPIQPQSPYSASKIGAESIIMSLNKSFDMPVIVPRVFNTFGPRQSLRAIIPNIIVQALRGTSIKLGNTSPTRDFSFVLDTCGNLIALAESDSCVGEIVNLGTGTEVSIADLVKEIGNILNKELLIECEQDRLRPQNSEVNRLVADRSKFDILASGGGYLTLTQGLAQTIEWFDTNLLLYQPVSNQL